MAQNTLNDGSSGDVVIRSGPPASGGRGGGGFGGGGGNRVGASGNFGGVSSKTAALRKRANRERQEKAAKDRAEAEQAAAREQEQNRIKTRQQLLAGMVQRHDSVRAELDRSFADKTAQLVSSLEQEISAAKRKHSTERSERWQLYLISKEKSEIDGLIARKTAELNAKSAAAKSFDGHDPLARTASDYLMRLDQFADALSQGHQVWENAYGAAHEARLLSAQIGVLTERSSALARLHAEQTIVWRERDADSERQRQVAQQRDARIRFKQQSDEDRRLEQARQANTLSLPTSSTTFSTLFNPRGISAAGAADGLAVAVARATTVLGAALGARIGAQVAIFVAGMAYPSELGNGELTPEQRARLFHAVAVPAQALELYDSQELQTIADAGGSVESEYRVKVLAEQERTAVVVTGTGGKINPQVPVVNAVLDPLTGQHVAEIPGSPKRYLQFSPPVASAATIANQIPPTIFEPQLQDIPDGVDWRIQDCIVCVPGFNPVYLSFSVPPMGTGVVTGNGQPATADWWKGTGQASGAAVPSQIGDRFRAREFKSFEAFDRALWQSLGEYSLLTGQLDEINQRRLEQGFPPVAPKSTWVDGNREFELRYQERDGFWDDSFNLDRIRINAPNSAGGWLGVLPPVTPWPIPPVTSWKPLVPPGAENLGSTTSPAKPTDPLVYPGNPAIPVLPPNETFPAVDEGEVGANIPGYPGDMELPSPGLVFVGPPVEPLEVGPYNELSGRSRGDGLDIDHIPSRRALDEFLLENFPDMSPSERRLYVLRAPSIAIPSEVHRKFSETYGGRNTATKRLEDASNLKLAVDQNLDAIKKGLLDSGLDEGSIETGRERLHALHKKQGWY